MVQLANSGIEAATQVIEGLTEELPWADDDNPYAIDFWDGDFWMGGSVPAGIPRGKSDSPVTKVFDLQSWTSSIENGRIPDSELAPVPGTEFLMETHAASALAAMFAAARKKGINLSIGNTYRPYEQQASMYADYQRAIEAGRSHAPVAPPGESNHGLGLAVDLKGIEQGSRAWTWLLNNAFRFGFSNPWIEGGDDRESVEPWHWEYGQGEETPTFNEGKKPEPASSSGTSLPDVTLVPAGLSGRSLSLANVVFDVYEDQKAELAAAKGETVPSFEGDRAWIERQLYRGFMDAKRPDLAKMVGTKAFNAWIGQESGWDPGIVSKYYSGHGRNAGLFQFAMGGPGLPLNRDWVWADVDQSSWSYGATPYQQARMVVRYFGHLTADDIKTYAAQIRAGTYNGWG